MSDDLLEKARQQAEKAEPSMRSAALLRIARAESVANATQARTSLLEALEIIRNLPSPNREHHFEEARAVAAALDPALLTEIPSNSIDMHEHHTTFQIVQAMLAHGHVDAAFHYVLSHEGTSSSFPFSMVGNVLHQLDPKTPESATRRTTLLRVAVEAWCQRAFGNHPHQSDNFIRLFGHCWKELPPEEALQVTRAIVARATEEADTGTSAGYHNEIHFSSSRQHTLFQILHVMRHFDPALAQSLIDSLNELSAAARRYPNGCKKKLRQKRHAARPKAQPAMADSFSRATPKIFPVSAGSWTRLETATSARRSKTQSRSIAKTHPLKRPTMRRKNPGPLQAHSAPLFYQAGKRLGFDAAKLLDEVPDDDLRMFASIELAAALAGVPASSISSRKQRYPTGSPAARGGRIVASWSSRGRHGEGTSGSPMRSPDGRLIRCPKCSFQPSTDTRWGCRCGHVWNTFWTSGLCPACHFQWEVTSCHRCHEMSEHRAWYVAEP